ncbi:platelet-derived growth factor subunit B [Rhinophrynus dorsalis]
MNFGALLISLWFLHVVHAEGDPIPEEMYEKIAGGSVHSISDIRRLLQIDSVDEEEDTNYVSTNRTNSLAKVAPRHSRVIRSLDAEPAVLAECKTRTEVFEISRKMVDPTNANFLVWPSCVEVQRCSGCCNSKSMRCAATRIHIRHVQVNKILISRPKNIYVRVVVPLEDHLECKCERIHSSILRSHHSHEEVKKAPAIPVATLPPVPESRKEDQTLRSSKRKNRKFKHMPNKKEQRELLGT